MKCPVIVLLLALFQVDCRSLASAESKDNQTEVGQQRSARVHRVAIDEIPGDEDSRLKNDINKKLSDLIPFSKNKEIDKILSSIPDEQMENNLEQREDVDLAFNEMTDSTTSMASIKPVLKQAYALKNFLNSPEELDIYEDVKDAEKRTKSRLVDIQKSFLSSRLESTNGPEMKTVKNIAQYLDNVLIDIQNHVNHIRNVFDRLCRRHHASQSSQSEGKNNGIFTPMSQPKKVSIL